MSYTPDKTGCLRVDTHRSGPFIFQIGLDAKALEVALIRADDAYTRFNSQLILNILADKMEVPVLVSAVYSTNTIEGADLSEKETENAMLLTADQIQNEAQTRVHNLKMAYEYVDKITTPSLWSELANKQPEKLLQEAWFKELHKIVCQNLNDPPDNIPGNYRKEIKGYPIRVGDENHGGVYKPPQSTDDVTMLMKALIDWANCPAVQNLPTLLRAPLIHYYFERIHPFRDGNGRVGRLAETLILQLGNYKYVSKAMSAFYLKNIDKYYALFNECRKLADKHLPNPNTSFVKFFLEGILHSVNRLQDNANLILANHFSSQHIDGLWKSKKINERQHLILTQLINNPAFCTKKTLSEQPWYNALYKHRGEKTKLRDIQKLINLKIISINERGAITIFKLKPELTLSDNPTTSPK